STLMNRLCGTELLADAMPFATLDPTTRKIDLPDGYCVFLTDTVGFIRNLPTHLVAAFQSTLEEVSLADVILHVVDVSISEWDVQRDAVIETLEILRAEAKPTITVFNKVDLVEDRSVLPELLKDWPNSIAISAATGEGVPQMLGLLKGLVQSFLGSIKLIVPYSESALVDDCYRYGRVLNVEYEEDGIVVEAELVESMRNRVQQYVSPPNS
ncbi:MAG: GTPase HflX, partial [Chthonomonas sp.]|nr:GTPase HflX [Chthonomonas sp.]